MKTKGNVWLIVLLVVAIVVVALLLTRQGGDEVTPVDDGTVTEQPVDGATTPEATVGADGAAAVDATVEGTVDATVTE